MGRRAGLLLLPDSTESNHITRVRTTAGLMNGHKSSGSRVSRKEEGEEGEEEDEEEGRAIPSAEQIERRSLSSSSSCAVVAAVTAAAAAVVHPLTPSNNSMASTIPTPATTTTSFPGPTQRYSLNPGEMAAVKQLISGYRESAAFLLRSADELEQLLLRQA